MKILYIINARIPTEKANGIQIMKMCEVFASYYNTVELILPRRFNPIKVDPFDYYGIEKIFKIKRLPCLDLIPLDKYLGNFALWFQTLTFSFFTFPQLFKKADVIYTRDPLFLPFCFFKKNVVFEAHKLPRNYFFYGPFLKNRLKKMVVITHKLKELFVKRGVAENKILVASDGVDLNKFKIQNSKFKIRGQLNLPLDKKIVLYTGHLYQWKGVNTLAQASQYLPSEVEIYFVGGTALDIQKFKIQNSCLAGRQAKFKIHIIGHRPHSEIPYWLKAADILVLPNSAKEDISKYWTSPIKMFEYMAAKRPIVASDLPSIREILNEQNSILVEPDNPEDLAKGIKKALEDNNLAKKNSEQAFQDVQEYSWQKRAEKILKFIKNAK